jgi:hypothetical protein
MEYEFKKHILISLLQEDKDGTSVSFNIDAFIPELMYKYTPFSNKNALYETCARHNGVEIYYSQVHISDDENHLLLSLSEGSVEDHKQIVNMFGNFVKSHISNGKVSFIEEPDTEDCYVWKVDLATIK